MEVITPKQLHRHAMLIALVMLTLFVISALAVTRFQAAATQTKVALGRSLVTKPVHIHSTANGLAKFTAEDQGRINSALDSDLSEIGHGAQLSLRLQ